MDKELLVDSLYETGDTAKKIGIRIGASILFIIGLGVIGLAWWYPTTQDFEIVNHPAEGTHVVAFGDSLVEGVGARRYKGFVSVLNERLGISIVNLGVAGDTTADGLMRINQAIAEDPDIAMVLLGGNDVLKRVPQEEMLQNLRSITEQLQQAGAIVMLLGVPGGIFTTSFEEKYEALAYEMGAVYVPNVVKPWLDKPSLKYDSVHPNDLGYEVMATHIEPYLRELLP